MLLYSLLEFSEKHKLLRHVNVINLNKNTKPRTCHFDEVHEQILKVLYPNKFVFSTKSCYTVGWFENMTRLLRRILCQEWFICVRLSRAFGNKHSQNIFIGQTMRGDYTEKKISDRISNCFCRGHSWAVLHEMFQ